MFSIHAKIVAITLPGLLFTACGGEQKATDENMLRNKQETQAKVYKYDSSIQCEEDGIPIEDMRLELAKAGIDVICAQKAHDGFSRIAVCGEASGNINTFVIHNSNLPDAEKLGFKSTDELPEYQDQLCKN